LSFYVELKVTSKCHSGTLSDFEHEAQKTKRGSII